MDRDQTSNSLFDSDPVPRAAWLYYQEGKSQAEVTAIMGVSRVTVVKYLQTIRESGLIRISLGVNVFGSIDAVLQVRDKFNLQRAVTVSDGEYAGKHDDTKLMWTHLPCAGGIYLSQVIENGDVLGVAWERIIHQMSEIMTPKSYENVTVIQILSSMSPQLDLTTIEPSSQIAYKLSGRVASLYVSAVMSDARLTAELQAESIIRSNFDVLARCAKAFLIVGNVFDENPLTRAGVLNKKET